MPTTTETIRICPVYRHSGGEYVWVACPMYEPTDEPTGASVPSNATLGCCQTDPGYCPAEVIEIPHSGIGGGTCGLSRIFPDYEKIPRDTACCPLVSRGQIEEIHSRECLFYASDTEETHLVRIYLLSVTLSGVPQFYWPVGFEVTGYQPSMSLPVVIEIGGTHPEYGVKFSGIKYCLLVEQND